MSVNSVQVPAGIRESAEDGVTRLAAYGAWTINNVASLENAMRGISADAGARVVLDVTDVAPIDTSGAWLIQKTRRELMQRGATVEVVGASANAQRLMNAVEFEKTVQGEPLPRQNPVFILLDRIGRAVAGIGQDLVGQAVILGGIVRGLMRGIVQPSRLRLTSIVFHLDRTGLQAVPIMFLMSFLIGGIIAQQSIFQLRFFGAEVYVVDLVGILVLRELGVLLTAIMLAGRSGSAYTAEIGSMKMREEIDALQVIGLDPNEVLIMPRILALVLALPLLTFLADMSALIGGAVVSLLYANMPIETFIDRLRDGVGFNTLMVGLIKAPFMGLIVGLIAAAEGLKVEGSAESLGRQTTASVVKAIFSVIVADGLFAMFFAAIDY